MRVKMTDKNAILDEIAQLLQVDAAELGNLAYMDEEELAKIRDGLIKRRENRREEQEGWYDEWVIKCAKDD
jgi:FtsZ-binding cell division protein ZapB